MKKNTYISIILSIIAFCSYAQNLVPNPSFEIYSACPTEPSQISNATPWHGVTTNSTDYYNSCNGANLNVPACIAGWQYARTGEAYAGLYAINGYGNNYREYLQIKLNDTLQPDSCYLIGFHCNLYNLCRYGINTMGAFISSTAVSITGPGLVLNYNPQIISNTFLVDTLNWMDVSAYYQAVGGESYITIGNFNTDSTTDTLQISGGVFYGSYYLIDDVSVILCSDTNTIDTTFLQLSSLITPNIFTPNNDGINDFFKPIVKNIETFNCKIYNRWGLLVGEIKTPEDSWDGYTTAGVECSDGIYYYVLTATGKDAKRYEEKGFVQLVR